MILVLFIKKYFKKEGQMQEKRQKVYVLMSTIGTHLREIRKKYGCNGSFSWKLNEDFVNRMLTVDLTIDGALEISSALPPSIQGWLPEQIQKIIVPILEEVAR